MMGRTATTKLAIAISFFVLATAEAESLERAPQFVRHTRVEAGFFTAFYAMSTQWVSLQASSDLITWTNLIHFSTGKTNPIPFVDETAGAAEHRFYRVRSPGMSVDQAQELWHDQGLQDYHYRIEVTWHELVENAEARGASSISSLAIHWFRGGMERGSLFRHAASYCEESSGQQRRHPFHDLSQFSSSGRVSKSKAL